MTPPPDGFSIYMITNRNNGKYYIGQTRYPLWYRWSLHKSEAKLRSSAYFHKAIRKHGPKAFDVQVIAEAASADELNALETLWIWALRSMDQNIGYNQSTGGASPLHSAETRRKISQAHKGKTISEQQRRQIGDFFRGKPKSEDQRRKISEANKGTKPTEKTRLAVAEANSKRVHSEETRAKLSAAAKRGNSKGRIITVEARAKLAERSRQYWADSPIEKRTRLRDALRTLHAEDPIRSAQIREKLRAAAIARNTGRVLSPETRAKISAAHKRNAEWRRSNLP